MREIVEYYLIVTNPFNGNLGQLVNAELANGWRPWGPPSLSVTEGPDQAVHMVIQAMVRYAEEPKKGGRKKAKDKPEPKGSDDIEV